MEFHNSAVFNGKAIQADTGLENASPHAQGGAVFSFSGSSVKKFSGNLGNFSSWSNHGGGYENGGPIAPGNSVCFGQQMVGLKLHTPKDSEIMSSSPSHSASPNPTKRTRASCQNSQISRCQVEGCNIDLSSAKDYHRRHRICECHSKSPKVIVAGMERRFCQQCSRFHHLGEFDDKKRSCRRRLSDHNARRRRPHPEALHYSSAGMPSSLYDRRPPSFLLNRLASSLSFNSTWESSCNLKMAQAGSSLIRNSGSVSGASSYMNEGPNLPRALSLLSATASWGGLNPPESPSLDPFMQATAGLTQPLMPSESQSWPLISAQHVSAEQAHSISPLQ